MNSKLNSTRIFFAILAMSVIGTTAHAQRCPGLGSITLNVDVKSSAMLHFTNSLCGSASTTIAVGQSFAAFNWNTTATPQSSSVNAPGSCTVTSSPVDFIENALEQDWKGKCKGQNVQPKYAFITPTWTAGMVRRKF